MKIAVLKKDYSDGGGGAERYAREICSRLASLGHEIFVHSQSFDAKPMTGIYHVKIPKKKFLNFSGTTAFHKSVQKLIVAKKYDIIYAISRTFPSDFFRVTESLHCEWMKIRYPFFQRINPRHAEILNLEKKIFNIENTRGIICNSELTKKQVIANFAYPSEKILVIRNGINQSEFFPAQKNEKCEIRKKLDFFPEDFVILFAASDFKIKGLEYTIKALSLLPKSLLKRTKLAVVGGAKTKPFQNIANKLTLNENVKFIGKIKKIRDYYVASDILLHPSLYEPFANVCLEALACGLPVITTKTNGSSEIIEDSKNGFIISNAKDINEIAQKIANFATLKDNDKEAFAFNSVKAASKFTWDAHVNELIKLFKFKK